MLQAGSDPPKSPNLVKLRKTGRLDHAMLGSELVIAPQARNLTLSEAVLDIVSQIGTTEVRLRPPCVVGTLQRDCARLGLQWTFCGHRTDGAVRVRDLVRSRNTGV